MGVWEEALVFIEASRLGSLGARDTDMKSRLLATAAAALMLATASQAGEAPASSGPAISSAPAQSTMSAADAAKAKRATLRQCKRQCEGLYPVQIRTIGEGQALQRTEITGNVAGHNQCTRACDQGLPPQ